MTAAINRSAIGERRWLSVVLTDLGSQPALPQAAPAKPSAACLMTIASKVSLRSRHKVFFLAFDWLRGVDKHALTALATPLQTDNTVRIGFACRLLARSLAGVIA